MSSDESKRQQAALGYALAYGMDPEGGEQYLPNSFNRSGAAVPLSLSDQKLEHTKLEAEAPQRFVWEFLRKGETQALRKESKLLEQVYARLGEPGENLFDWWSNRARTALSDFKTRAIYFDNVFEDMDGKYDNASEDEEGGNGEPGFPTMAIVRVFCTKSLKEIVAEFERGLRNIYTEDEEKRMASFFDAPTFGRQRVHPDKFWEMMRVWQLRTVTPDLAFAEIGHQLAMAGPGKSLSDADYYGDVSGRATRAYYEAEGLLKCWAAGASTSNPRRL